MAHDAKHPTPPGTRIVPLAPPFAQGGSAAARPRGGTGASPGSDGVSKSNPVSWLIAELQDGIDQIDPAKVAPAAASPPADPPEPAKPPGDHELGAASYLMQRVPILRPAWSPPGHTPPAAADPHRPSDDPPPEPAVDVPRTTFSSLAPAVADDDPIPPPAGAVNALQAPSQLNLTPSKQVPPPSTTRAQTPPLWPAEPEPRWSDVPARLLKRPPPEETSAASSLGLGRFLLPAVVALPLGMLGGLISARLQGNPRPAGDVARATLSPTAGAVASPPMTAVQETGPSSEIVNSILNRLAQLVVSTTTLEARLERIEERKIVPPAELAELRAELGRLSATAGDLAPLPQDVRQIDDRVKELAATLKNVHDEIAAMRARAEKAALPVARELDRAVAVAVAAATPTVAKDSWAQIQGGIKLFKQSRFKEALAIFNRVELSNPDDARVWYYAALCLGYSTGQWTGGTLLLVEKGIERERAGTPSTSKIDAAFSDLPPALGRDWLAEYRRRAAIKSEAPAAAAPPPTTVGDQRNKD